MSLRDAVDSTAVLPLLSGLLFAVPLFDMWQDTFVEGTSVASAVLENSIILLLSGAFVWLSVWLRRNDWDRTYGRRVARWSILGTACVALAYGWVLGLQLFLQGRLKPVIIAADGVVIGGLVLFLAGIYNARSDRQRAARAVERDRFSALFDNTSDAMMAVEPGPDGARITEVNDPFRRAFDGDDETFAGRDAVSTMAERALAPDTDAEAADTSPSTRLRTVIDRSDEQVECRLATADGPRDYLVDYVPVGDRAAADGTAEGFLIFTDITPQKERERQFATLSEGTEGLLEARSVEGVVAATRTLGVDLFDDLLVAVWRYDDGTDAYHPLSEPVGATGAPGTVDLQPVPARAAGADDPEDAGAAVDTAALDAALSAGGTAVEQTTVRRLPGEFVLSVSRLDDDVSTTERYLLDLLVTNARAAIRRVEREEELDRRNDQLEFVNSLLRHDIQNSMTVIRARGEALAESLSDQQQAYADTIVDQSDDVIDLVDEFRMLLDALTDVAGDDTEPVDLSSVLRDRVDTLETTYPDAVVTADVPEGMTVRADQMLGNVFGNVLTNAVDHNDRDAPQVDVTVAERDGAVVVRIEDDGPGVPDEHKEAIFRRGNRGLKESDVGSGFGLFFVDTMMEKYGGDVAVDDADPRGAVFRLSFQPADDQPTAA